jgi:hypothetical protein
MRRDFRELVFSWGRLVFGGTQERSKWGQVLNLSVADFQKLPERKT